MTNDIIKEYIESGFTESQAYKMAGMNPPGDIIEHDAGPDSYDSQMNLAEIEAVRTLRDVMKYGKTESARVSAAKELLDRKRGKAAQSVTIDSKATVTHEYLLSIDPADAYKRLIEGAGVQGGGDTVEKGAGVNGGDTPAKICDKKTVIELHNED